MPEEEPKQVFALVHADFEGLSDAAKIFIEKVSAAAGGLFAPHQVRRMATARADAELIAAEGAIKVTDLQRRAVSRWLAEEEQKQKNMESITEKAVPLVNEKAHTEKLSTDWLAGFFDKARLISDQEMQELWAKILAQEANQPGGTSKRTLTLLAALDKSDADAFSAVCRFCWTGFQNGARAVPLIFNETADVYTKGGISWVLLTHLTEIGLINFESLTGYNVRYPPMKVSAADWHSALHFLGYQGRTLAFRRKVEEVVVGKVRLTRAGEDLFRCVEQRPVPGYFEYVHEKLKAYGYTKELVVGSRILREDFFPDGF